tara:strand:- start:1854 stop:3017 length:1164 start_codon:yes stop_codon:yes gene_type:complete
MRNRLFRYLLFLLGIAAAIAALFLFLSNRPLSVEVARPADNVQIQVFGLGTVEARILSNIGFEVGAALVKLNADHGDRVNQGDVLARLHNAEQEARVAKAKAGMVNAAAAVKTAEAAVGKSRAVLAQRKQTNQRKQMLVARRTVSVESAEEAQMEQDVAAAELAVAISGVDVAKAVLEDATAQYAMEKVLLDHHVLRAPFDAIVVQRHKELGSVLSPGDPVFTLVVPETVWVLAYVDEARAGEIRVGQPAEVRLRSLSRQMYAGYVIRIGLESDRVSEERRVYIACDSCPRNFHLGEQAEIYITTGALDRALMVPETAIENFSGTTGMVWTIEGGELRRRKVGLGHRTLDSRLEITGGVPDGAFVVRTLRPGLREGRAAKVLEESQP